MKWSKKEISGDQVTELSERYGVDKLTASILLRRGLDLGDQLLYFLEDDPRYLHNPFLFKSMEDAVDRVLLARDEGEKVLIFGDRDVDGVTGTVLLLECLTQLGLDASFRLPEGDDAYGLTESAVRDFAAGGGGLLITVDNGISCLSEISVANQLGVDCLVLDHHEPPAELPPALAIINPKCQDSGYPFRDLCGCAVAYKFAQALRFARSGLYKQQVCLLNVRPVNEAMAVEAVKLHNLVATRRIEEFLVPGELDLSRTRLIPFLRDQQILVWDEALQRKLLKRVFGPSVDISLYDVREEVASQVPASRGLSLLRLREHSRIARYRGKTEDFGELDTFESVFVSCMQRKLLSEPGRDDEAERAELQLVAMGTVSDLMPLKDENRILVRRGLRALTDKPRPGLAELLEALGMSRRRGAASLSAKDLSWSLGPAINAAGRMGRPSLAVELLVSKEASQRSARARDLVNLNQERRALGDKAWVEISSQLYDSLTRHSGNFALCVKEDLHRGITGIMASKASKALKVPCAVITRLPDGNLVGSVRSTRGLDLKSFLEHFADLFIDHGGHECAAGFSMEYPRLPEFQERLASLATAIELEAESQDDVFAVDAELPLSYMEPKLLELVDRLEPNGDSFPPLTFMAKGLKVNSMDIIGRSKPFHLKLTLQAGKFSWPAMFWQAAERAERDIVKDGRLDAIFRVERDSYNGGEQGRLVVLDAEASRG